MPIFELIITQVVVFLVIVLVIRQLMYRNTMSAVNRLKHADEENEKKLKELRENIREAEETYQKRLAQMAEEVKKQREAATQTMGAEKEKMLSKAKAEASAIVEAAKDRVQRIDLEEDDILRHRALSLAEKAICRLLNEKMQEAFHEQIVEDLLKEVELMDGKKIHIQGKKVEVISRYPLRPPQKARVREVLEKKLGTNIEIQETVKKEMAGGLILTLGSLVIDGSLECRLKEVIQKIEAALE
jgi:F-type H+-transporting ATPase subunit b